MTLYSAITPKSEDKYVVKVFNWSEVHLSEMTLLQNLYRGFLPYATFGTWKKTALAKNRISKIFILCTQ